MAKKKSKKEVSFQVLDPNVEYGDGGVPQPEAFADFSRAYALHVWVYRCVSAIATNVAGVEILPYIKKKDGSYVVDEKHELFELLSKPNPYMSGYDLREYTAAARKLTGNAYWYLENFGQGDIKEIWPLLPSRVRPVASKSRMIDHYVLDVGNGRETVLPYEQVIHFRSMNPESFIYGVGMSALKNAVATDIFAQVWNKSFFRNSARPDGTLESDQVLRPEIRQRVIQSWNALHGGASGAHKTAVLEGGLKYKQVSASAKDMDFVNLRKDLRIEICAGFGVPPSVVGLLEYANYSNMEQQTKMFWDHTLMPDIKSIADTLTMRAEQITFRTGVYFQGDTDKVPALQANQKELAETAERYVNIGVPLNQVIEALDLPFEHVDGGDVPRQPAPAQNNLNQPAGGSNTPPAPPAPPAKSAKELKDAPADERELIREVRWKSFDDRVRQQEGRMLTAMRGFFSGQRRRVLKSLDERAMSVLHTAAFRSGQAKVSQNTVAVFFDLEKENDLMRAPASRVIKGAYFDFAVAMAEKIDPSFDFNLTDPVAEAWLAKKVSKLVQEANGYTMESITDEVRDAVAEAVSAGFSESETISQIADRISAVYDFADETRAERIARTEVIGAANAGGYDAMKRTGVQRKEWLSSRDNRVRETHQKLDGQIVGVGEAFVSQSGASLQYPGDPDGPADEVVNCRCTPIAADE